MNVYYENDPVPAEAESHLQKFFGRDDSVYVRAKFVTKGSVLPEDLIFETKESRSVSPQELGLSEA